jgi:CRP-like cAMP-binding protein
MASWTGEERRSSESISAREAVLARSEAEQFQEALATLPRLRFARRRSLERRLEQARNRERDAVSTLGGQRDAATA